MNRLRSMSWLFSIVALILVFGVPASIGSGPG